MKEICCNKKQIGKGLLIVGLGSFMGVYLIELSKIKLLPLAQELERIILLGYLPNVTIEICEPVMVFVGVCTLFAFPLYFDTGRARKIKINILFFLLILDLAGIITVIVRGELFFLYLLLVWASSVFAVLLLLDALELVYCWVKIREDQESFDLVKLTFLWTIVAFVLGKIL